MRKRPTTAVRQPKLPPRPSMTITSSAMLLAGMATLLLSAARGQTNTPPAPPPAAPAVTQTPAQDETVQMTEFEVTGAKTTGYEASETMTGPRVATKIIDLPYTVVNLTSEFFKDFGVTVFDENLTYIGGFTA